MTGWPQFITKDLGDSEVDSREMQRRWEIYDREMRALIAKGGVHQDEDGWWVDDATGELIGPDPEIERPLTEAELARAKPFGEAFPALRESVQRSRGRPKSDNPKRHVSLRLDTDVVEKFKATGKGWQARINEALRKAQL